MRYFKDKEGQVFRHPAHHMTCNELNEKIEIAQNAFELATQSNEQLDEYESCEYLALQRLKNTKIWIHDDAVEMTEKDIKAHLNPAKTHKGQAALVNAECTKRINARWNQIGQMNASLGVYGEEGKANCAEWISLNRTALIDLLAREKFLEINVKDDQYWPVFEDSIE